jgi:hypothetical protein
MDIGNLNNPFQNPLAFLCRVEAKGVRFEVVKTVKCLFPLFWRSGFAIRGSGRERHEHHQAGCKERHITQMHGWSPRRQR